MRLPDELKTERLQLRPPRGEDADFLYEMFCDLDVVRYLSFKPLDQGQARALLERNISAWKQHHGELTAYLQSYTYVLAGQNNVPLGTLGVRKEIYGYELSYSLARNAWGKGFTAEAVRAMSDWLLANGAWRVFATCHVENAGSQRVLEKAGFEREGLMRRYFTFPNLGPEPADGYLYAKVR